MSMPPISIYIHGNLQEPETKIGSRNRVSEISGRKMTVKQIQGKRIAEAYSGTLSRLKSP